MLLPHRGRGIYLDKPDAEVGVQQQVVAEQLEGVDLVWNVILRHAEGLEDHLDHPCPHQLPIDAQGLQPLLQDPKGDLGAAKHGITLARLRLFVSVVTLHHAVLVVTLDRRVRQVDKLVVNVLGLRRVGHRREAGKAILVDEGLQWIEGRDSHIRAHVPLVAAQEEWIADILLDDGQLTVVHRPHVVDHLDAAATAAASWLHDPEVGDL
mmetsp:Transcript_1821/g.4904  ORF Transcript_1821/g.4904 Transcript_1821/m.4904 type:complete len:209 (-) Transcript_1821:587-1213(-)